MPQSFTHETEDELVRMIPIPDLFKIFGSRAPMLMVRLMSQECWRLAADETLDQTSRVTFREWGRELNKLKG